MLEAFDSEELEGLLFQHRSSVVFSVSEDDRPHYNAVVICKASPDELLDERGARVHDDVLSRFPFQAGDDSFEFPFHDPRILPFGLFQGARVDNLIAAAQKSWESEQ